MSSSANPQTKRRPLADLSGTILLAGAGKMGSAMLEGWLALGLAPEMIAVIEPQPSREIAALMDAVTALSGSGPAYVFLLAEAMARAGTVAGLPAALAATLARATVAGAGELLHRSPLDAATLRQNVTSPGGTTAAALEVLMAEGGLERLMTAAIAAATKRSRDLAG